MNHVIQAWKDNGLPPNIPFFMTEGNDLGEGSPDTVKSGLWLADYVGAMMTAGAGGTYYFHYISSLAAEVARLSFRRRPGPRDLWSAISGNAGDHTGMGAARGQNPQAIQGGE